MPSTSRQGVAASVLHPVPRPRLPPSRPGADRPRAAPDGPAAEEVALPDPVLAAAPPPGHQAVATDELVVAAGTGTAAGSGPLRRYLVEVETGSGVDQGRFAAAVEAVLSDPRSWIGGGDLSVQRVDAEPVDFRVTLAHPDTVDRRCAPLQTNGRYSCWDGARAMLNLTNWVAGIPDYAGDVGGYRRYLVNHEVGHALGHGHLACPAPGAAAPAMMQQTKGLGACRPNSWPYPA